MDAMSRRDPMKIDNSSFFAAPSLWVVWSCKPGVRIWKGKAVRTVVSKVRVWSRLKFGSEFWAVTRVMLLVAVE